MYTKINYSLFKKRKRFLNGDIYIYIYLTFCKTNNFNINSTDSSLFAFVIKKKVIKDVTICTRSQKVVLWHDLSRNQYHIVILPGLKAQCVSPAKHIQHNCIEISYFFFFSWTQSKAPECKKRRHKLLLRGCSVFSIRSGGAAGSPGDSALSR